MALSAVINNTTVPQTYGIVSCGECVRLLSWSDGVHIDRIAAVRSGGRRLRPSCLLLVVTATDGATMLERLTRPFVSTSKIGRKSRKVVCCCYCCLFSSYCFVQSVVGPTYPVSGINSYSPRANSGFFDRPISSPIVLCCLFCPVVRA